MLRHCPPCCPPLSPLPAPPQPVHLSPELEALLLSMCEDAAARRTDLLTVLEACELHHRASVLLPAERLVRQLVEEVFRNSVSALPLRLTFAGGEAPRFSDCVCPALFAG